LYITGLILYITNPTETQLKKAMDEEEHNAILFLYKAGRSKYGKLIEHMRKTDILQRKDPLSKTVVDACRILAGWKKNNMAKRTTGSMKPMRALHLQLQMVKKNRVVSKKKLHVLNARKQGNTKTNVTKKKP